MAREAIPMRIERVASPSQRANMNSFAKILTAIALVLLGFYVYSLDLFSENPPQTKVYLYINPTKPVPIDDTSVWNTNRQIAVFVQSVSGIKSYTIKARTKGGLTVVNTKEVLNDKPKKLKIVLPKPDVPLPDKTTVDYEICITDWSNANLFSGSTTKKNLQLTINSKQPVITIISHSNKISYGGSALVVFHIDSVDIGELSISNGVQEFIPFPFMKEGYYAALIAWSIASKNFSTSIFVRDSGYNTRKMVVPFIRDNAPRYSKSTIVLKEDFLNNKLDSLISDIGRSFPAGMEDNFEKFQYINETIRNQDDEIISAKLQEAMNARAILLSQKPNWENFTPLKGYSTVGRFGDARTYIAPDKQASQSVHLGIDMASVKNDKIMLSNDGKIVLSQQLGVYGKTILVEHSFGLVTLYSHLQELQKDENEVVRKGDILGLTGQSGWAFGDHLHFGVLVGGVPVRVSEWLDSKWIKNNITDIFESAALSIQRQGENPMNLEQ